MNLQIPFFTDGRWTLRDLAEFFRPRAEPTVPEAMPEFGGRYPFVDLRGVKKTKARGRRKGVRKWERISAICLHQTAVDFGSRARRLLNVPVHGGVLADGNSAKIVLLHPATDYLWHAHALNRLSIGIEVSCRAAGVQGEARTFWRSKKERERGATYLDKLREATDAQLEATRELVRYYVELAHRHGGKITRILAHRQGHKSRVGDPGSRVWREVGLWAQTEFGLVASANYTRGSGNPIPQAWDPNQAGVRYSGRFRGF